MIVSLLLSILLTTPVRIAVLSDRTGGADDAEFETSIRAICMMHPDVVLSVGDFIEGYGDTSRAAAEWSHVLDMLAPLTDSYPFVFTPGNHDIWDPPSEELWRRRTGSPRSGIHRHQDVVFLVWDTSRLYSLTDSALIELEDLLREVRGEDMVVLSTHKPMWLMADQDSSRVEAFFRLVGQSSVDAVVGGHIHTYAYTRRDGVLYVAAGPSGVSIDEPSISMGTFNQIGWLTLWPDSCAYAEIDPHHVYPEELNTAREELLAYLYMSRMLKPRPLEPELESAVIMLRGIEDTTVTVFLRIDPANWYIDPCSLDVELSPEGTEIHLAQGIHGPLVPLPRIHVELEYGERNKVLSFSRALPMIRRIIAPGSDVALDGRIRAGEYPGPAEECFIGPDGSVPILPPMSLRAAVDGDTLAVGMEMDGAPDYEDESVVLYLCTDRGVKWLRLMPDGEVIGYVYPDSGARSVWSEGYTAVVSARPDGWSAEVGIDLSGIRTEDVPRMNVYRAIGDDYAVWTYPVVYQPAGVGLVDTRY